MRTLYHWPLDPKSRQVRIALAEKRLKFKLEPVNPWNIHEEFAKLCLEGVPPCLVERIDGGQKILTGARAICEYAAEHSSRFPILSDNPLQRAEARRMCDWIDDKFTEDVHAFLMSEKVEKSLSSGSAPDPAAIREGRSNLTYHLSYFTWILEQEEWLAGQEFSLADIAAGASISCLDFIAEIPWKNWPVLKMWYQKFKSRPSVQPLLSDRVPGIHPPAYYKDLDF